MAGAVTETHLSHSQQLPIPPSVLPQVAPSTYLLSHLVSGAASRPSGRLPTQTRRIDLNTGSLTNANGSALVRLGNTSVVCGVRAEILDIRDIANYRPVADDSGQAPDDEDDSELSQYSLLVPNIELQTGASPLPAYQPSSGPPSALAQSLTQRILSTLHSTNLIRASDLRIYGPDLSSTALVDHEGVIPTDQQQVLSQILKGYYTLYLDILVLSHDGSLFDAALMALLASLRTTTLPKADFNPDTDRILCSPNPTEASKLHLRTRSPLSLSWRVFTDPATAQKWLLLDPDAFEEDSGSCPESGTIVVDGSSGSESDDDSLTILRLEKNGGTAVVGRQELREILDVAKGRWSEWDRVLERACSSSPLSS